MSEPAHPHCPDPATGRDNPLDWPAQAGAVDDVLHEMERRVAARRRRRRWAVASVASALVFSVFFARGVFTPVAGDVRVAPPPSAIVVGPERQVLSDGSVVELRPGAKFTVEFSAATRRVVLEQGEAHFEVAKNPHRPFVVAAGNVEFRAVGTAFSVQRDVAEVELIVTEGRVAVDPAFDRRSPDPSIPSSASGGPVALVDAGNRVVVPTQTAASQIAPRVMPVAFAQIAQRMAWRVPLLEFSGTPLADAVVIFNQHNKIRLVLGDPGLARVRLSGILRADNLETLLLLLAESHGIRADRHGDTEIVLRPSP